MIGIKQNSFVTAEVIDVKQIIEDARSKYTLHQLTEMESCLEFLADKNLNGFIELGSANGGSFHCWASVISNGPKVSVDWNRGFGMSPTGPDKPVSTEANFDTVKIRNNNWRADFTDVRTVEGDCLLPETVEACRKILNGDLVDWLFIDATHEYAPAYKDFHNYKEFVRPGGYIGFHDVSSHEPMRPLWKDIKKEYGMAAEFLHGHGIGIIQM